MLDTESFEEALKVHYSKDETERLTYDDNPTYALLAKQKDFGGRWQEIPIWWANSQGRSRNFQRAQSRSRVTNSRVNAFLLTRVKDYGIGTIESEVLEASENDGDAIMSAATAEMDSVIQNLANSISQKIFRQGFGEIAQIASIAGDLITLKNPNDIVRIEVGQELMLSVDIGASNTKATGTSTNGLIVKSVQRSAGTFKTEFNVTDATNGIPTAAANDYIFVRGDRDEAASPTRGAIAGFEAWLPSAEPTNTPFFNVDRSLDTQRLGGLRKNGVGVPIEECLIETAAEVKREGGSIDHYIMPFSKWINLEKTLGSRVVYVNLMATATIGFRALEIQGPSSTIKCIADRNCQEDRIWGLTMKSWKLYSLGEPVKVQNLDGLKMLRRGDDDSMEFRYVFRGNLGCNAPGWNVNIAV